MSSKRANTKTTKKHPQCATSSVFAMFDQFQFQEFKEAFNMIDQNWDGFTDKEDLYDMLPSMMTGTFQEDYPKELLTIMSHQFTDEEVDELSKEAPLTRRGNSNYTEFTRVLKHRTKDKDD
ncbi:myosin regulatory light polypeptide 9-like isoform X1 [Chionomys nivalis]|uniref:myosin regulatory light polypeptide 9-like isoform X1 n=1 Tax=Chionomys nivalis TaxID=269649 RepID=UPI002598A7AF|nr:myosin regulatory light polypeptide 9-like isoform X1 [Chionomys nivalis]